MVYSAKFIITQRQSWFSKYILTIIRVDSSQTKLEQELVELGLNLEQLALDKARFI